MAGKSKVGKARTLWKISRPVNCAMGGTGAIIAMLIGLGALPRWEIALPAFLAVFLIMAGGNSLNDYYDVEIDKVNKPGRPIPSGQISKRFIWTYSTSLLLIGFGFSLFLPLIPILIALINSILLGLYAWRFKVTGFFGNILISYLVASVFAFGGAAVGHLVIGTILGIIAFFTNAAREVLKDLEDIRGDELHGAKTLPGTLGGKKTITIANSFLIIAILISPLPYLLEILSIYYMIIALIVDVMFAYIIAVMYRKPTIKNAKSNQGLLKIASILGLIAFLVGVL